MNIRVKIGDQIFEVEVGDVSARPILARVDRDTFEVWPEEAKLAVVEEHTPAARPAAAAAPAPERAHGPANGDKNRVVTAPIPGVILSISVKPGDSVVYGQELCMLEAMKMKNAIRAVRTGTIAAIHAGVGDHVGHGQPLIEFSD
jgi:biotin carboxyl carrier protein